MYKIAICDDDKRYRKTVEINKRIKLIMTTKNLKKTDKDKTKKY